MSTVSRATSLLAVLATATAVLPAPSASAAAGPATRPGAVTAKAQPAQLLVHWKPAHGSAVTGYSISSVPPTRTVVVGRSATSAVLDDVAPGSTHRAVVTALHGTTPLGSRSAAKVHSPAAAGAIHPLSGRPLAVAASTKVAGRGGIPSSGASAVLLTAMLRPGAKAHRVTLGRGADAVVVRATAHHGAVVQTWLRLPSDGHLPITGPRAGLTLRADAWSGLGASPALVTLPTTELALTGGSGLLPTDLDDGGRAGWVLAHVSGTVAGTTPATVSVVTGAGRVTLPVVPGPLDRDVFVPLQGTTLTVTSGGRIQALRVAVRGLLTKRGSTAPGALLTPVKPHHLTGAVTSGSFTEPATAALVRISATAGSVDTETPNGGAVTHLLSGPGTTTALLPLDLTGHLTLAPTGAVGLSVVLLAYGSGDLVRASATVPVTPADADAATATTDSLTFPAGHVPHPLQVGSILVLPISPATPAGAIRVVTAASTVGSSTVLATTDGGILDAFPVLSIHTLTGAPTAPVQTGAARPREIAGNLDLDLVLAQLQQTFELSKSDFDLPDEPSASPTKVSTTKKPKTGKPAPPEDEKKSGAELSAEGKVAARIDASADLRIQVQIAIDASLLSGYATFFFLAKGTLTAKLHAEASGEIGGTIDLTGPGHTFPPIEAGPITILPKLTTGATLEVGLEAKGSYDVTVTERSLIALNVFNAKVNGVVTAGSPTVTHDLQASVALTASVVGQLRMTFLLEGLAGPYFEFDPGVEAAVSTEADSCVTIDGTITGLVGIDLGAIGKLKPVKGILKAIGVPDPIQYTSPTLHIPIFDSGSPCHITDPDPDPSGTPTSGSPSSGAPGSGSPSPTSPAPTTTPPPPPPVKPVLTPTSSTLYQGQSGAITDTTGQSDSWSITPSDAGSVSSSGVVSIGTEFYGDATVTATEPQGILSASVAVHVPQPLCTNSKVDDAYVTRTSGVTGPDGLVAGGHSQDDARTACRPLGSRVLDIAIGHSMAGGDVPYGSDDIVEQVVAASGTTTSMVVVHANGAPVTTLMTGLPLIAASPAVSSVEYYGDVPVVTWTKYVGSTPHGAYVVVLDGSSPTVVDDNPGVHGWGFGPGGSDGLLTLSVPDGTTYDYVSVNSGVGYSYLDGPVVITKGVAHPGSARWVPSEKPDYSSPDDYAFAFVSDGSVLEQFTYDTTPTDDPTCTVYSPSQGDGQAFGITIAQPYTTKLRITTTSDASTAGTATSSDLPTYVIERDHRYFGYRNTTDECPAPTAPKASTGFRALTQVAATLDSRFADEPFNY